MLDERLASKNKIYLASHGDADGISSAYLTAYAFRKNKPEVYFPRKFKHTKNLNGTDADIVTDKCPDKTFKGIVIDHHPDHKEDCDYPYWIGSGGKPAALLALELFKEKIPKELWWKAVPGIVGDGVPEKVPGWVWKAHPHLLESLGTIRKWKGKTNVYKNPVWFLLSSPLNSACRAGKRNLAFTALVGARTPLDIIQHPGLQECKTMVNKEVDRARMASRSIDLGTINVLIVNSNYKIASTLAWELNSNDRKTAIVINEGTGNGSVRGVLVDFLKENIDPAWGLGGHSGFAGISFPDINAEGEEHKVKRREQVLDFVDALREAQRGI